MKNKKRLQFFAGILLMFLFTQIQWGDLFFKKQKEQEIEIDNSALFYTESETATAVEFFLKKSN